jgi:arylformamidase
MSRLIDLTLPLRPGMRGVEIEIVRSVERDGWTARTLHLYSHAGTHMDAQTHFAAGPETIDQIPLDRCLGSAWVANLESIDPKALITITSLGDVASKLKYGECLLLRTGWSRHVENPPYYRDNFPRVSEELAQWCADQGMKILGVEPPSVADVNNLEELTRVHKILLGGGVTIVEGLTNLDQLRSEKVLFAALPLKIERGDGCPCRAFAIEGGAFP